MKKFHLIVAAAWLSSALGGSVLADDMAYDGTGSGGFGIVDLNTGAFTAIGSGLGQTPAGLGTFGGVLYAASYNGSGTLYSINTTTGALTSLGNSGVYYEGGIGSTTAGLYGIGSNGDLYSINPTNGAASMIGPIGVSLGAWRDLSAGGNTLYFGNGPDLYKLNTTTGAATLVGAFGGPAEIGAMVFENGTLYGGDEGRGLIDTINVTTGAATPITGAAASDVWGLAPVQSPVPEPPALPLLCCGVLALATARHFRNGHVRNARIRR